MAEKKFEDISPEVAKESFLLVQELSKVIDHRANMTTIAGVITSLVRKAKEILSKNKKYKSPHFVDAVKRIDGIMESLLDSDDPRMWDWFAVKKSISQSQRAVSILRLVGDNADQIDFNGLKALKSDILEWCRENEKDSL